MKNIFKAPLFIAIVCILLFGPGSLVKPEEADTPSLRISKILFEGTSYPEEELLRMIKVRAGDELSLKIIGEDVKRLYASDSFDDIKADLSQEGVLTYIFRERPRLSSLEITGAKEIKEEEIREKILLKEEGYFDEAKLKFSLDALKALYLEKGYRLATFDSEVEPDTVGVNVRIIINEGKKVKIKKVDFVGNEAISSWKLRWTIQTGRGDIYDEAVLDQDLDKLRTLYSNEGYLLSEVFSPEVVYDEESKKPRLMIAITISEGPQFKIGRIKVGETSLIKEEIIHDIIESKSGQIASMEKIYLDQNKIYNLYSKEGYVFTKVIPSFDVDKEKKEVRVTFNISEGEKTYIEDILVSGNAKTRERVIRRELLILPGEIFNGEKVRQSRQKLFQLGYFDKVDIDLLEGSRENKKVLKIEVGERRTGTAKLGMGYSSNDGLLGTASISENNLFGRGYKVKANLEFGKKKSLYELSFTNPYLYNKPVSMSLNLYNTRKDRDEYTDERKGGSIFFGRPLGVFNRVSLGYKYEDTEISDVSPEAAKEIQDLGNEPKSTRSLIAKFTRDTRDNIISPKQGYKIQLSQELAGGKVLGGNVDFYKPDLDVSLYLPTFWKFVLVLHAQIGAVDNPLSDEPIPDYEKFYLGGQSSIRGYRYRQIHPVTYENGEKKSKGGETEFVGNIEYKFPLVDPLEAAFFFDVGNTYNGIYCFDFSNLYYSAGLGITFETPMGPIRIDYGFPLWDEKKKNGEFHFSIGGAF
ncbi:outer membrane protein assembly factor BamA [bacterium]|nr:outer membrane protein assembly factor BamA [bacterium]